MRYASGEIPKAGDNVKHLSGKVSTVFELDLQANKASSNENVEDEKIKMKFRRPNVCHCPRERIQFHKESVRVK